MLGPIVEAGVQPQLRNNDLELQSLVSPNIWPLVQVVLKGDKHTSHRSALRSVLRRGADSSCMIGQGAAAKVGLPHVRGLRDPDNPRYIGSRSSVVPEPIEISDKQNGRGNGAS